MKIGIFCSTIGFGGSQNTAASLAVEMARSGHDVTFYVDRKCFRSAERWQDLDVVDLPVNVFSPSVLGCLSFRNILRCLACSTRRHHDVILCISSGPLPLVMLVSLLRRVPCVHYAVTTYMHRAIRVFRGISVANSDETRGLLSEWLRCPPEEIPVIRARINVSQFHPAVKYLPVSGAVRVLLVSRLETSKTRGIIKTIDAFRILHEQGWPVVLNVCGDGRDRNVIAHHVELINQHVGGNLICMLGATSDVAGQIQKSDIVIGVGRSAWEAMACGKPTVVVGQEGLGGVVCEANLAHLMRHNFTARGHAQESGPKEIAEAMIPLIESLDRRRELGRFAMRVVREYYDVRVGASEFLGLFDQAKREETKSRKNTMPLIVGILSLWLERYCKSFVLWCLRPRTMLTTVQKAIHLGRHACETPNDGSARLGR